jgi:hypothetical protein
MQTDRRAILHLVAMGRITPAEAERLLIAWNDGRESLWVFAACIAFSLLAQLNPQRWLQGLPHTAHSLLPGSNVALHHTLSLVNHLLGGIV